MKQNGLIMDELLYTKVTSLLTKKSKASDFGNGRGVRNVFEAMSRKKDSRIAKELAANKELQDKDFVTIVANDLEGI
jgi:hypothetical protein